MRRFGYRVKSKNGVLFRKWANKVLKDYLIKGYAINDARLKALEKTVQLIDVATRALSTITLSPLSLSSSPNPTRRKNPS